MPTFERIKLESKPAFLSLTIAGDAFYINGTITPSKGEWWQLMAFWYTAGNQSVGNLLEHFTAETEQEAIDTAVSFIVEHNKLLTSGLSQLQGLLENNGGSHVV